MAAPAEPEHNPLRAAAMAWQAASLFFVFAVGAFYFLCTAVLGSVPYLWILPACFAAFWVAKYGYAILRAAANGVTEAPVPSIDTLGPFDGAGPIAQLLLGVAVYQAAHSMGGVLGMLLLGAAIVALPASIGVFGVTHHVLDSLNPVLLWRLARGMGRNYLLVLGAAAAGTVILQLVGRLELPAAIRGGIMVLLVLSQFGFIGGAMFGRRLELGLEPRSSPERTADRALALRARELQRVLDEVYGPMRARDYTLAVAPLRAYLVAASPDARAADVPFIMGQVQQWNDKRGLATVTRCVVSCLLEKGELALALGIADDTCNRLPGFAFDAETVCLTLAGYAQSVGRAGFGLALIERYAALDPASPLGPELTALRTQLQR